MKEGRRESQSKIAPPRDLKHSMITIGLSVAPPAEPRGEIFFFFVQILGGEKLFKFGENGAVKNL